MQKMFLLPIDIDRYNLLKLLTLTVFQELLITWQITWPNRQIYLDLLTSMMFRKMIFSTGNIRQNQF